MRYSSIFGQKLIEKLDHFAGVCPGIELFRGGKKLGGDPTRDVDFAL